MEKQRHLASIAAAGMAFIVSVTPACRLFPKKSQDQTGTASIDAIMKNNVNERGKNACGKDAKFEDDPDTAFRNAYSAAPKVFRDRFPESAIVRHADPQEIQKICEEAGNKNPQYTQNEVLKAQLSRLLACARVEQPAGETEFRAIIHIMNNTGIIYNNLIRTMAWTYSALIDLAQQEYKKQNKSDDQLGPALERFVEQRKILTSAVFVDLKNLGTSGEAIIKGYDVYKVDGSDLLESPLLQHFLFSEITDSFYCSVQSNSEFFTFRFMTSVCRYQEFAEFLGKPFFAEENDKIKYCPNEVPPLAPTAAETGTPTPTSKSN